MDRGLKISLKFFLLCSLKSMIFWSESLTPFKFVLKYFTMNKIVPLPKKIVPIQLNAKPLEIAQAVKLVNRRPSNIFRISVIFLTVFVQLY